MELLESHFNTLSGNLTYDETSNTYEMFSNKSGENKHNAILFTGKIEPLAFDILIEQTKDIKNKYA